MKIFKSLVALILAVCAFAFAPVFAKSPPLEAVANQNMQIVVLGASGVGMEIVTRLAARGIGVIVVHDVSEDVITTAKVKPPTIDARQFLAIESWQSGKIEREPFYISLINGEFAPTLTNYKSPSDFIAFSGFDTPPRAKI